MGALPKPRYTPSVSPTAPYSHFVRWLGSLKSHVHEQGFVCLFKMSYASVSRLTYMPLLTFGVMNSRNPCCWPRMRILALPCKVACRLFKKLNIIPVPTIPGFLALYFPYEIFSNQNVGGTRFSHMALDHTSLRSGYRCAIDHVEETHRSDPPQKETRGG